MSEKESQKEEIRERATDEEIVTLLSEHIDNPCEVIIGEEVHNIRDFYVREAERLLDENTEEKITDLEQIERLKKKIQEYRQE
ncbi:hypothetical protein KKC00_01930 [Patescibacteria group bacterium]|nr:hypothetical protein [Patescibacteria group bacterium]